VTGKRLNALRLAEPVRTLPCSRVKPIPDLVTTIVGSTVTVSALNIQRRRERNVAVTVSPGNSVSRTDNGVRAGSVAGDGIYSGTFCPAIAAYIRSHVSGCHHDDGAGRRPIVTRPIDPVQLPADHGASLALGDDTSAPVTRLPDPIRRRQLHHALRQQ
jgi:hypothetical protein